MEPTPRLQPQSMGDLFDAAVRLYRSHFTTFFGITAVLLVPMTILKLLAMNSPGTTVLGLLQAFLINNLATGVLAIAISRLYLGQPIALGAAYRQGMRYIWPLLVASFALGLLAVGVMLPVFVLLFALGFGLGSTSIFLLLAVPLVAVPLMWLLTRYAFVTQAVVLEQRRSTDALKRSWQLTRNSFWRILAVVLATSLLTYLLTSIPALLITWLLRLVGQASLLNGAQAAGLVIGQVGLMLAMPIQLAIYTLLYYDMRVRYEAYDLELLGAQAAPLAQAQPGA